MGKFEDEVEHLRWLSEGGDAPRKGGVMDDTTAPRAKETLGEAYDRMDADARKAVPRRLDVNRLSFAEARIRDAYLAVEKMPSDTRLTDAVILLERARACVANFVDGVGQTAGEPREGFVVLSTSENIDAAVDALNGMLACDPTAILGLVTARVPCNESLCAHPTCQVHVPGNELPSTVGFLGVLNGVFGIDTNMNGFIAATYEGGKLIRFQRRPLEDFRAVNEEARS